MNLISTIVTLISLYKLYYLVKKLHSSQRNLGLNKKALALHVFLLSMTSILSVLTSVDLGKLLTDRKFNNQPLYTLFKYAYGPTFFFECLAGAFLQIIICYICQTLGA